MSMGRNPDGTITVRVVLSVTVDPEEWVADMMNTVEPVLDKNIRQDVKRYVRSLVANGDQSSQTYLSNVTAQGLYA